MTRKLKEQPVGSKFSRPSLEPEEVLASLPKDSGEDQEGTIRRVIPFPREGAQELLVVGSRELLGKTKEGVGGTDLGGEFLELRVCLHLDSA